MSSQEIPSVVPSSEEIQVEKKEIKPVEIIDPVLSVPSDLIENVKGRKAAEDLLDLAREECGDDVNDRFWETLRDEAIKTVGLPTKNDPKTVKGMNRKQATEFRKDTFPDGKYMNMTVGAVEVRDPDYIKRYPYRKSLFQLMVEKYLHREPDLRPRRKQ